MRANATPPTTCGREAGVSRERRREHVRVGVGEVERHRLADLLGHVLEIGPVALGQDHLGETGTVRGQHLLLDSADRQHLALQRDLASHADGRLDGPVGQQRDERGGHGDAGRRPVLGNGAGRNVDVHPLVDGCRIDAELVGVRPHVAEGDVRALLHDVAELTGERQRRLAVDGQRERRGLDEQHVATHAGDGQARGDARHVGALGRSRRRP